MKLKPTSVLDRKWTIFLSDFVLNCPNLSKWPDQPQIFNKDSIWALSDNDMAKCRRTAGPKVTMNKNGLTQYGILASYVL